MKYFCSHHAKPLGFLYDSTLGLITLQNKTVCVGTRLSETVMAIWHIPGGVITKRFWELVVFEPVCNRRAYGDCTPPIKTTLCQDF